MVQLSPNTHPDLEKTPKLIRNKDAPPHLQPSPLLLREHFIQALIENVLGDGLEIEHRKWLRERDGIFFKERINLMHRKWMDGVGKDVLEHYFFMQLYGCLSEVEGEDSNGRWSSNRLASRNESLKAPEQETWPDRFDVPPESSIYITESNPNGYSLHPCSYKFLHAEYVVHNFK